MVKVCSYAQLQQILGFALLLLLRGADSTGEFEQICLCTLFREIRPKITKNLGHKKKKNKKISKIGDFLPISMEKDGKELLKTPFYSIFSPIKSATVVQRKRQVSKFKWFYLYSRPMLHLATSNQRPSYDLPTI